MAGLRQKHGFTMREMMTLDDPRVKVRVRVKVAQKSGKVDPP